MVEFTPGTLEKLAEMLRPPEPEVLQGDELRSSEIEITSTRDKIPHTIAPNTPKNIEEFEEQEAREAEELGRVGAGIDSRRTPEYSMNYQQFVTAEDVYLQIGPKTPSSSSCENLILKIKMPGDKMENVDLDVDTTVVTVNSSQYHLKLQLPHGINPDLSKANWDADEQTLILKLKLDREFDFINF